MQTFVACSAKFKGDDVHDGLVEIDFMFCAIFWRTCVACEMNCGGYFLRRSARVSLPLLCVFLWSIKLDLASNHRTLWRLKGRVSRL